MSLSSALSNAVSGLSITAQRAQIVSSNISNASVDNYARRSIEVSTAKFGGVTSDGITRHVDPAVQSERRLSQSTMEGHSYTADGLTQIETVLGAADSDGSLSNLISDFEASLVTAAADPSSDVALSGAVTKLTKVTDALNLGADTVRAGRQQADTDIATTVEALNQSLARIDDLNKQISASQLRGYDASNLMDQRQETIDTIAEILPIKEVARAHGTVGLMTTGGLSLISDTVAEFSFTQTPVVTVGGELSGLSINGEPATDTQMARLDGGTLGAAFEMRDVTLPGIQQGLDDIAADLMGRLQSSDPTLATGQAGLLTDDGNVFDSAYHSGLAGRITVNANVTDDPVLLRTGVGGTATTQIGDSSQILRWIDAMGAGEPAAAKAADFSASVGAARIEAEDDQAYAAARYDALRELELSDGVDTDYELQSLLQIEQAYAANARIVQAVDAMLQQLMEL